MCVTIYNLSVCVCVCEPCTDCWVPGLEFWVSASGSGFSDDLAMLEALMSTLLRLLDCMTERDCFVKSVYTRLRSDCMEQYGLEFQVVDLNWGTSPDLMDTQTDLTSLSFREIQKCQTLSPGPYFIVFLGQKYGACDLPSVIPAEDYLAIQAALKLHKGRATRDRALLETAYCLDENNVPPVYVLQDRTLLVPALSDNNLEVRISAQATWQALKAQLVRLVQKGAQLACLDGNMDGSSMDRYFLSPLESQVRLGLELADETSRRCVVITRSIEDLHNYTDHPQAASLAELKSHGHNQRLQLDPECAGVLVTLKNQLLAVVPQNNTIQHRLLWRYEGGVDPVQHRQYLDTLCEQLYATVGRLIQQEVQPPRHEVPSVCQEAALHWSRCRDLATNLYNQDTPLTKLREYVTGTLATPLVVYGAPGSGKSKVISKFACEIEDLLAGSNYMLLLRYISASTDTLDTRQLLVSLCSQLSMALEMWSGDPPSDMAELVNHFSDLLKLTPCSCRLLILLDGIDQLLADQVALTLTWIPQVLPSNVRLILTVDDSAHGLLERLRLELLPDSPDSFLEVAPVGVAGCQRMFHDLLLTADRSLTPPQKIVFLDAIEREPLPLFVELLLDLAKGVSSSTSVNDIHMPSGWQGGICSLLGQLEVKHGKILVSRTCAYMAASSTGLTECEIEDILSMDNDVLNEVFTDFEPAIRRLPCLKWLSLKQDLEVFLSYSDIDGVTTVVWKHPSVTNIVSRRYLSEPGVATLIHSNIADYFLGNCNSRDRPADHVRAGGKPSPRVNMDTNLPSQAGRHVTNHGPALKLNKRMYKQVPLHLHRAGRYPQLNASVYFSYGWLYGKIQTMSVQSVLQDLARSPCQDAILLAQALRQSRGVIERDVSNLPTQITGRLLPYRTSHANIQDLILQCDTAGLRHCALVPNFSYPDVPGTALEFSLRCPTRVEQLILLDDDKRLACKNPDDLYVHTFDLVTGQQQASIFVSSGDLYATPNGKHFLLVDHVHQKAMKIHDAQTGSFLKQVIVLNHVEGKCQRYQRGPLCLSDERLCAVVTVSNSVLCVCHMPSGEVLNTVPLDGRADICSMSPDMRTVFCNSHTSLLAFDVYTHQHLLTIGLDSKPSQVIFSPDGILAFLRSHEEAAVTVIHLDANTIDMAYRLTFDDKLPGDVICNISLSPDGSLLLVRGTVHLLVHDRGLERVVTTIHKPDNIPADCQLPGSHRVQLSFTQAAITADNKFLVASIFRNVYTWQVSDAALVSIIQAPVGLVTSMLVTRSSRQVLTHVGNSPDIQVWTLSGSSHQVQTPDRLTGEVAEFQVTADNSLMFVKCRHSQGLAVVRASDGCLLDLLTHDTEVQDVAVSPDGAWALVATCPRLKGAAFKLWNLAERRVVMETGDMAGYCVGMNSVAAMILVAQRSATYRSPYHISTIDFVRDEYQVREYTETSVMDVRSKPFVTCSDEYLVIDSSRGRDNTDSRPCLLVGHVGSQTMSMSRWDATNMDFEEHLQDILEVRPCRQHNGNLVAAIFSCRESEIPHPTATPMSSSIGPPHGFFLLDVAVGSLTLLCIPFLQPSSGLDPYQFIFSPDHSLCLDETSNIFNTHSGEVIGQVSNHLGRPRSLALGSTVVVYCHHSTLRLVRIADGAVIANCQVGADISHVHVCLDERTLLVGCRDGTVLSYTIIDPDQGHVQLVLATIPSRRVESSGTTDDRRADRSGNKMRQTPGPAKMRSAASSQHSQELQQAVATSDVYSP